MDNKKYFLPEREFYRETAKKFYELVQRLCKGLLYQHHGPSSANNKDNIVYSISKFGEQELPYKKVTIEYDFARGSVAITFGLQLNNQTVLWAVRGSEKAGVAIVFDHFTEETEAGMAALIANYFNEDFSAFSEMFYVKEKVPTMAYQ